MASPKTGSQEQQGIRHPAHFPSFSALPDYDSPFGPYYSENLGSLEKTMHWCFLADIVEAYHDVRPRVRVRTAAGENLIVHFYHEREERPTTFKWSDIKPGACLAMMYAYRKSMADFTYGVRVEYLDGVFVFKGSLEMLHKENDKLLSDPPVCFLRECHETRSTVTDDLLRCTRCKLAKFCCKEHQKLDWISIHKNTCNQLQVLKQLIAIEHQPFSGHINFRFEVERVTVEERQERNLAAISETMIRLGALPQSTVALVLPLQRLVTFMASKHDWAADVRGGLGIMASHCERFLGGPFASSALGRQLADALVRAKIKCQHSVTDLRLPSSDENDSTNRLGMGIGLFEMFGMKDSSFEMHVVENCLEQLPLWSIEAGCTIDWYMQMGSSVETLNDKYASAPGWTVVICDGMQFVARHSSGRLACFSDEPGHLSEIARLSKAQFPVLILQPHISRADETKEIVHGNVAMPRLFTAWLRADFVGSYYRRGSRAVVPRYGLDDATTEDLSHIARVLLDAHGICGDKVELNGGQQLGETMRRPLFIEVSLDLDLIEVLQVRRDYLNGKIVNSAFHITLVYNPEGMHIESLRRFEGKKVQATIIGCAYSINAVALHVGSVVCGGQEVPHFQSPKPLHITIARANHIRPCDTFNVINNALSGQTMNNLKYEPFENKTLEGTVTFRYGDEISHVASTVKKAGRGHHGRGRGKNSRY